MEEQEFYIGQIFEKEYPPEAAEWCNNSQKAYISEVTEEGSDIRKFQIVAIPDPTLDELKERKLNELKNKFNTAINNGYLISYVEVDAAKYPNGLMINCSNEAEQNISNLLSLYSDKEDDFIISFCVYDNTFVDVTKAQVKKFHSEVIEALYNLRQKKYDFREAITNAITEEELSAIVIEFPMYDFRSYSSVE